jgi:uncharacterized protein (DUF1015 family)
MAAGLKEGTLIREPAPALYVYHQCFSHEGRELARRMIIVRGRLTPFSEGIILPHERTFGGPKEDRLALMRATMCNLSAVFGLYSDSEMRVLDALEMECRREPDAFATLDGVENKMWIVTDSAVHRQVGSIMADKKVYIADGHHRYETSLHYRDELAAAGRAPLGHDHPARFIMLVLAGMEDPGCIILPYHRVLVGAKLETVLRAWAAGTAPCSENQADLTLVEGASGRRAALRFTDRQKLRSLDPRQPAAWYELDAAYLHRCLLDVFWADEAGPPRVEYVKSSDEALRVAQARNGVALLMNATPMAHLRAVSEGGGLMPPKSTYFHPKLATGLTINPLS